VLSDLPIGAVSMRPHSFTGRHSPVAENGTLTIIREMEPDKSK